MEDKFATELLHEVKLSAKRWFIAFLVVLGLWFTTIGIFIWYISLPVEVETTNQSVEDIDNGEVRQIGGDYYESSTDNNKIKESNEDEGK